MNKEDTELIYALKAGNQEAFDKIFRKYYTVLCIEAKGYSRNNFLIEEIVCDIFTKLWVNRQRITINTTLKDYLIKAVHNNCINYYRMKKVQDKLKEEVDGDFKRAYSLTDLGQNPLDYMITDEIQNQIINAVESLPPRYKEAFKLSRFNDMTYEEIAREMNISVNGVKLNIKKALEHLRQKLHNVMIICILIILFEWGKLIF